MTTNEKIIQLRKQKNINQEELAHQLGVSRQAISKWENGTAAPTNENLMSLATYFGVSVSSLIDDEVLGIEAFENEDAVHKIEEVKKQLEESRKKAKDIETEFAKQNTTIKFLKIAVAILAFAVILLWLKSNSQKSDITELRNNNTALQGTINNLYTEINNIRFITQDPDSYSNYFDYNDYSYSVVNYNSESGMADVAFKLTPNTYNSDTNARFVVRGALGNYSFDAVLEDDYYTAQGQIQCSGADFEKPETYNVYLYTTDADGVTKSYILDYSVDFGLNDRFTVTELVPACGYTTGKGARFTIDYHVSINATQNSSPEKMVLEVFLDDYSDAIFTKEYGIEFKENQGIVFEEGLSAGEWSEDRPISLPVSEVTYYDRIEESIKDRRMKADSNLHAYLTITGNGQTVTSRDLFQY